MLLPYPAFRANCGRGDFRGFPRSRADFGVHLLESLTWTFVRDRLMGWPALERSAA